MIARASSINLALFFPPFCKAHDDYKNMEQAEQQVLSKTWNILCIRSVK